MTVIRDFDFIIEADFEHPDYSPWFTTMCVKLNDEEGNEWVNHYTVKLRDNMLKDLFKQFNECDFYHYAIMTTIIVVGDKVLKDKYRVTRYSVEKIK